MSHLLVQLENRMALAVLCYSLQQPNLCLLKQFTVLKIGC